jgi:hypothetical protein
MLESFALNGRVGDIGIKDKVIEVKLVFPNDERTQDELAFLFPIKKGLATVRILAAVNKGYTPGRRRSDRDETGTPLLPGVVDMSEICHACGRTVDCVNEPFFAKPVKDGKEIILCDACYRVPQPEEIDTPPAETLLGHPIVEDPSLQSGEIVFGTAEQIGDPDLVTKFTTPEQLEQAADAILEGAPPATKVCATCGHPYAQPFVKEKAGTAGVKHFWKTTERDEGAFEVCPSCGAENQFPEEGGEA